MSAISCTRPDYEPLLEKVATCDLEFLYVLHTNEIEDDVVGPMIWHGYLPMTSQYYDAKRILRRIMTGKIHHKRCLR